MADVLEEAFAALAEESETAQPKTFEDVVKDTARVFNNDLSDGDNSELDDIVPEPDDDEDDEEDDDEAKGTGKEDDKKPEDNKPVIPDELRSRARAAGILPSLIRQLSPEDIEEQIEYIESKHSMPGLKPDETVKDSKDIEVEDDDVKPFDFAAHLNEDDDELHPMLPKMDEHYMGFIKTLKSELKDLKKDFSELKSAIDSEKGEEIFNGLLEKLEEPMRNHFKNTDEQQDLLEEFNYRRESLNRRGKKESFEDSIRYAAYSLHPNDIKKKTEEEITKKVTSRKEQAINRAATSPANGKQDDIDQNWHEAIEAAKGNG